MKYSDLKVWQKAIDLVAEIYKLTADLPVAEKYGLASQMQRAAVSVPANIAEGHGRKATKAYLNYLSIANGSLMELETHLQISSRLDYIPEKQLAAMLSKTGEVGRMINGLRAALTAKCANLNPES